MNAQSRIETAQSFTAGQVLKYTAKETEKHPPGLPDAADKCAPIKSGPPLFGVALILHILSVPVNHAAAVADVLTSSGTVMAATSS